MSVQIDSPKDDAPDVSVVIPYGGGQLALLQNQLHALTRQDAFLSVEVIVAANTTASITEVESALDRSDAVVRVVDASAVPGPSAARNRGWRNARADYVLFCDADDEVPADWVSSLYAALGVAEISGTPFTPYQPTPGLPLDATSHSVPLDSQFGGQFFPSCSVGFRRATLFELGGFDESLETCEDLDICYRARLAGYTLRGTESTPLRYAVRNSFHDVYVQHLKYGRGDIAFTAKHRIVPPIVSAYYLRTVVQLMMLFVAGIHPRFRRSLAINLGLCRGWATQYRELARSKKTHAERVTLTPTRGRGIA